MIVCVWPPAPNTQLKFEPYLGDLAIIAGSDTTSNAISNTLYFLMTNPTVYKRLQAEIDGLGDNVMDYATLVHLPYLNAVL